MLNNVKKSYGYRDIIYNVRFGKFYTYEIGDQYQEIEIGVESAAVEQANVLILLALVKSSGTRT